MKSLRCLGCGEPFASAAAMADGCPRCGLGVPMEHLLTLQARVEADPEPTLPAFDLVEPVLDVPRRRGILSWFLGRDGR